MTSTQTMLKGFAVLLGVVMTLGCSTTKPELTAPGLHIAPYDTRAGEVLWALVPLANESGTTAVDPIAMSDAVVSAAEEIRGVRCLPINRTIEAMRSLGISRITSEAQARSLAQALGAQGILVGTITAWDPYDPPTIGLTLAYFPTRAPTTTGLDPQGLQRAATDQAPATVQARPAVVTSEHLDGRSHEVQMRLRTYAEGRNETESALGWRVYLASMDLYTKFAAYELVGRLLEEEWLRLARETTRQAVGSAP